MLLTDKNPRLEASVTVLGMFDGVHRGHAALLSSGRALADEVGVPLAVHTFEPHPLAVLRPELQPERLTTLRERAGLMASFGVDVFCVNRFTRQVAGQAPEAFLRQLTEELRPLALVAGFNYTFGDRGRGNAALLRQLGPALGYEAHIVPEVTLAGGTVSSTRIRLLIEDGRMKEAALLLGRAYELGGMLTAEGLRAAKGKVCPKAGSYSGWLVRHTLQLPVRLTVTEDRRVLPEPLSGVSLPAGCRVRILFYQ